MSWISVLTPLQWALIAIIPPAIISLYFLKLKRHPVEVPSTYLWSRTIEDLHVNSIWQRLRQSLLLFLQLLVLLLAILACLRPGWQSTERIGGRSIIMIDTSASMSATDISGSRLGEAKKKAIALIEQMESSDVAMVISFSDVPRIEQPFTNNRSALRQAVNKIKPTNRRTDISEALRHASGLANPGRTSEAGTADVQVADALPATMYIISDGGVPPVIDFQPGNLSAEYLRVGSADAANVGIVAFSTERNAEKPGQLHVFARLENSGPEPVTVDVVLSLDDAVVDARSETIEVDGGGGARPGPIIRENDANKDGKLSIDELPEELAQLASADANGDGILDISELAAEFATSRAKGVTFELNDVESAILKLEVQSKDHLVMDNVAYAAINTPRRARVLVIGPKDSDALEFALTTTLAAKVAAVKFAGPEILETSEHQTLALSSAYDLIIYDRCVPKEMPESNTFFIGRAPPAEGWTAGERQPSPLVVDIDRLHPLMHLVELGTVAIYDMLPISAPEGAQSLIDSDYGSLLTIAPRGGFEDAVLTFEMVGEYPDGEVGAKTNWSRRKSFPVFVMNMVRYLGGGRGRLDVVSSHPGQPVKLRTELPVKQITVESPVGLRRQVEGQTNFIYTHTDELGVYSVQEGNERDANRQHFAINLFDSRESDLVPREKLDLPYFDDKKDDVGVFASTEEPSRQELWKWLLLGGLVVLVFEWYVYNRRVYL